MTRHLAKTSATATEASGEERKITMVITRSKKKLIPPDLLDFGTLQEGDGEIQGLVERGQSICGKYEIQKSDGAVWATKQGYKLWLVI